MNNSLVARISSPENPQTRNTRRIARGDLDPLHTLGDGLMRIARVRRRLDLVRLEDRVNPVANDLFADAVVLTGQTAQVTFGANYDIFGTGDPFTGEPGEPDHAGVSGPIQSAWYRWTAPNSGRAYVESSDFGGFGVVDAVYTGDA